MSEKNCDVFYMETLDLLSIDALLIRELVMNDDTLQRIMSAISNGKKLLSNTWNIDPREFSIKNGLLVRSHKIVIPERLRKRVLDELHVGHFRIVKMKGLARVC